MPVLTVYQPRENAVVGLNNAFSVTGQVTDKGMPEPVMIDSVTFQVDGGTPTRARLTHIPNTKQTIVNFAGTAEITSGADPHTLTVTAGDADAGGAARINWEDCGRAELCGRDQF